MKLFACSACGQSLFFENIQCTRCGRRLAYLPDRAILSPVEREGAPERTAGEAKTQPPDPLEGTFRALAPLAQGARVRLCRNYVEHGACNWAVPIEDDSPFCLACRLDEIIPNLSDAHAKEAWQRVERAKRRLVYTLLELGLPVESRRQRAEGGLAFAFKADVPGEKVMTGHDQGLITLNVAEADSPFREQIREQMGEAYRTLLGHFRHEIGHYYWDRLVRDTPEIDAFRKEFGDERASYEEALKRHYEAGPPADWPLHFVSAYASMHPWEDWAESWAHYLHMVDTLGTARSYGLALQPEPVGRPSAGKGLNLRARKLDFDDFDDLMAGWPPLTVAMNSLNRSMGLPDLYPFVLSERAQRKLRLVHDVVERASAHPAA
jgi:hypothetical protein